jgi:hypothetical protein
MNGEENVSQRRWPEADDRKFYIQRGIPIIPTLTFLTAIGIQTILGVRYISGLEAQVNAQSRAQNDMVGRVDKIDARIEAIQNSLNQGSVPAALNQRAITDLERQVSRLESRVEESERRQSGMSARDRAGRER